MFLLLGLFVGGVQLIDLLQHGGRDVERRVGVDERRGVDDELVLPVGVDLLHGAVEQVLRPVREDVVLLVERLGLLLGVVLIGCRPFLEALLLCLRVARGDEPLLELLLQLRHLGLEVLFALRPALLRLLGLLLQGLAFGQEEVALRQHGFDLHVGDIARADPGRRFGLGRLSGLFRRFRAAGGHYERCSQHRKESFFHIVFFGFW